MGVTFGILTPDKGPIGQLVFLSITLTVTEDKQKIIQQLDPDKVFVAVSVGEIPASSVERHTKSGVSFNVPNGVPLGRTKIEVAVGYGAKSETTSYDFEVTGGPTPVVGPTKPLPTITGFFPASAGPNTSVMVTGTNLDSVEYLCLNTTKITGGVSIEPTEIVFRPKGVKPGNYFIRLYGNFGNGMVQSTKQLTVEE